MPHKNHNIRFIGGHTPLITATAKPQAADMKMHIARHGNSNSDYAVNFVYMRSFKKFIAVIPSSRTREMTGNYNGHLQVDNEFRPGVCQVNIMQGII